MSESFLQFLGCGDAFGSGGRFQTCFLFQSSEQTVLIDCGPSSLIAMRKFDVDPATIDTIVFSHLHGDHFGGIPFFLLDGRFVSKREKPLTIAGPQGTEARVRAACDILFPGSYGKGFSYKINFVEMDFGETTNLENLKVTPFPAVHPSGDPSQMLRLEMAGKVVTYTGDTEWTDNLIPAAAEADLLICECYAFDEKINFHLDYKTLTEKSASLTAKKRILTHMNHEVLSNLDKIDWLTAEDGMTVQL
ncbi:MAG: MBL fold metallo-hydrolase [Alphaproteobacteria bacterium]|nr:MBL fold metallo-hydrolase [Rhodospirillales bacterium]MCW9045363.1 MBL fold metallo-hydrolase [Alphaproteobacteria bacterium]